MVRGGIANPRHESSEFDSHPHLQYGDTVRCGLGSHKPEEMVRVHLAPPKKDVDFCIGNAYIEVNRDEAIASISHAH